MKGKVYPPPLSLADRFRRWLAPLALLALPFEIVRVSRALKQIPAKPLPPLPLLRKPAPAHPDKPGMRWELCAACGRFHYLVVMAQGVDYSIRGKPVKWTQYECKRTGDMFTKLDLQKQSVETRQSG